MRAPLKVVLLVAVVLVATLSAVVWKTQALLLEDKLRFINDSSLKQVAPLKRLVSEKISSQKESLVRFATTREAQGAGHANGYGSFDVVALIEPAPAGQSATWAPTWIEKGPGARTERWPEGYDLTLLKSLQPAKVKDGAALWVRLSDSVGAPVYAVMVSVEIQSAARVPVATPPPSGASLPEKATTSQTAPIVEEPTNATSGPRRAVVVGFASDNPLAPVTEDYIGSINTVFLLDDRGYVASHVDRAYLGSVFSDHSIAKEVMKGQKLTDTGEYEDLDGKKVIGHFERIENTNLTAVITTPVTAATSIVDETLRNTILVGGSVGLLGLILAYLVGSSLALPVQISPLRNKERATDLGDITGGTPKGLFADENDPEPWKPGAPVAAAPIATSLASPNDERLKEERKYAYQAFHASLAARLREPLLAVLGHVQLVKTKTEDEAILTHADSIEREARLAKDAIEHWQILEEAPSLQQANEKVDLEKTVLAALADKSIELEGSGIEVVQDLTAVPMIRGSAKDLETALENMIDNAIEAMRDRPRRRFTVKLTMVGPNARLTLEDTGIGMTKDVQDKAFEPFFKAFETPRHMGLGLAFVQNVLKRSQATCDIESTPGEGARFVLKFPIEADAKKSFDALRAAPVITAPTMRAPAPMAAQAVDEEADSMANVPEPVAWKPSAMTTAKSAEKPTAKPTAAPKAVDPTSKTFEPWKPDRVVEPPRGPQVTSTFSANSPAAEPTLDFKPAASPLVTLGGKQAVQASAPGPKTPSFPVTPSFSGSGSAGADASEDDAEENDQFQSFSFNESKLPPVEKSTLPPAPKPTAPPAPKPTVSPAVETYVTPSFRARPAQEEVEEIEESVAEDVEPTPPVTPTHSGTEWQVKIRRPKPKGQS